VEDQRQRIDLFSVIGHKQIEIDMLKAENAYLKEELAKLKESETETK
jgi:hypothetical protein